MPNSKTIFQHLIDLTYPLPIPNFGNTPGFSFTKDIQGLDVDNIWVANSLDNLEISKTIVKIKDGGEFALVKSLAKHFVKQVVNFGLITASRRDFVDQDSQSIFEMFAGLFDPNLKTLITFVPPDSKRLIKRGFHLPELLTKEFTDRLNIVAGDKKQFDTTTVFVKSQKTKRQTGLDREHRLINLNGKIQLAANSEIQIYDSIFIIDDVCTTGATINECAIQIRKLFPDIKVYGLAVASNI